MRHNVSILILVLVSLSSPVLSAPQSLVGKWMKRSFGDVNLGTITLSPNGTFSGVDGRGTWRAIGSQWVELRSAKAVVKWHLDEGIHAGEKSVTVFDMKDVKQDDFQLIPVASPLEPGFVNPISPIIGKWDKGPIPITLERSGKFIFGAGRDISIGTWKTAGVNRIVYQFKGKQVAANWKIIEKGHRLVMSLTIPNEKPMTTNFWR
jgi:hypothetical protein